MLKAAKALLKFAGHTFSTGDSCDEYTARREALGMKDDDPRASASVASAYGVPVAAWMSKNWRDWNVQERVKAAMIDRQK